MMGHKINDELQPPHKSTSAFRLCGNGGGPQLYDTYKRCSVAAVHGGAPGAHVRPQSNCKRALTALVLCHLLASAVFNRRPAVESSHPQVSAPILPGCSKHKQQ